MAVSRLQELAFGTISDPGSATEGPGTGESWEVRSVVVNGPATIETVADHNDDGTFENTMPWETISDSSGGGLEGRAEPIVGGGGTNPREAVKITSDGSDIAYIIKGVVHT